ncbi:MAG: NfeD family protein [Phycisphaerales bacterium JB040]
MESMLYIGIALLGASLLLLVAEAFVPSGGLIAVLSAISAVAGVVILFNHSVAWGVTGLVSVIVLGPVAFFGAMNLLPETPFGQRLIGAETEEERAARLQRERDEAEAIASLVGAEGRTLTACRPVGEALIEGERYEVHAEGGILETGTPIRVVSASRRSIRVRAV